MYEHLSEATLLSLALKELAGQLPNIGTLVITPDMLTSAIGSILSGGGGGEQG